MRVNKSWWVLFFADAFFIVSMLLFILMFISLLLTTFGCSSPIAAPDEGYTVPPGVINAWHLGQADIVNAYGVHAALGVGPELFYWEEMPTPFRCGDVVTVGCFSPDQRRIRYTTGHEYVARHEACHAILWFLVNDEWKHCGHA